MRDLHLQKSVNIVPERVPILMLERAHYSSELVEKLRFILIAIRFEHSLKRFKERMHFEIPLSDCCHAAGFVLQ